MDFASTLFFRNAIYRNLQKGHIALQVTFPMGIARRLISAKVLCGDFEEMLRKIRIQSQAVKKIIVAPAYSDFFQGKENLFTEFLKETFPNLRKKSVHYIGMLHRDEEKEEELTPPAEPDPLSAALEEIKETTEEETIEVAEEASIEPAVEEEEREKEETKKKEVHESISTLSKARVIFLRDGHLSF